MVYFIIGCIILLAVVIDYCLLAVNKSSNTYRTKESITVQDCEDLRRFENKSVVLNNGVITEFIEEC